MKMSINNKTLDCVLKSGNNFVTERSIYWFTCFLSIDFLGNTDLMSHSRKHLMKVEITSFNWLLVFKQSALLSL